MGILGCGVQGRTNPEALKIILPELSEVKAYDISEDAANRYAEEMKRKTGLNIQIVKTPKDAVEK